MLQRSSYEVLMIFRGHIEVKIKYLKRVKKVFKDIQKLIYFQKTQDFLELQIFLIMMICLSSWK